jgi:hypothetical protein
MRNQAMTIPGMNWRSGVALAVTEIAGRITQIHVGRCLCQSMLVLSVLALMSAFTVGVIVLLACTILQATASAN